MSPIMYPGPLPSAYRCVPDFLQNLYAPGVRGKKCVGTFGAVGVLQSRNANNRRGFAVERGVIVGSTNSRLSRFVAAAARVAKSYDSGITMDYRRREADAKTVLESLMVLGKARRGE